MQKIKGNMKFELKKLLLNGHFGSIRLGDTPQKVVRLLGRTKAFHLSDHKNPRILKFSDAMRLANSQKSFALMYGTIEIWFHFGKLALLYSDHFGVELEFKKNCYFDPWIIKKGLCIRDFISILEAENIQYSIFRNTLLAVENERVYEIYLTLTTYLIFTNEAITISHLENDEWIHEITYRSCCEIVAFNLFDSIRDLNSVKYLVPITDLQELPS